MNARELILHNFWLKAFSLVLATMIWFAIHSNLQPDAAQGAFRPPEIGLYARPIMLMTSPDDHTSYMVEPLAVNVKVNGDKDLLAKLNPNDIQVYVDLTAVPVVHGAFQVDVKLPRNMSLQQVSPSHVHVEPAKPQ